MQQRIDLCSFYLSIKNKLPVKGYKENHALGSFVLKLNDNQPGNTQEKIKEATSKFALLQSSNEFWFYVSNDPKYHLLYVEHDCKENVTESCRNSSCGFQDTYFGISTDSSFEDLDLLQFKNIHLVVSKYDTEDGEITVTVHIPSIMLTRLKFPSEGQHKIKKMNKAIQGIMNVCHGKCAKGNL